ncbi:MAG TPA: SRPBCC family protein [Caulobacteraceae bacterium]|nr:SRPBCC family protein [Caulobacteraceae bacterium]
MPPSPIHWPARFEPGRSPVHVRNELTNSAPATTVWAALIAAPQWPDWYANAHDVVVEGGARDLGPGARFTWKTFGVALRSMVEEFIPETRIAWLAEAFGVSAWHAWLITPTEGGCRVLTEETQHGVLARAGALFFLTRMSDWHQRWLEGLAGRAGDQ